MDSCKQRTQPRCTLVGHTGWVNYLAVSPTFKRTPTNVQAVSPVSSGNSTISSAQNASCSSAATPTTTASSTNSTSNTNSSSSVTVSGGAVSGGGAQGDTEIMIATAADDGNAELWRVSHDGSRGSLAATLKNVGSGSGEVRYCAFVSSPSPLLAPTGRELPLLVVTDDCAVLWDCATAVTQGATPTSNGNSNGNSGNGPTRMACVFDFNDERRARLVNLFDAARGGVSANGEVVLLTKGRTPILLTLSKESTDPVPQSPQPQTQPQPPQQQTAARQLVYTVSPLQQDSTPIDWCAVSPDGSIAVTVSPPIDYLNVVAASSSSGNATVVSSGVSTNSSVASSSVASSRNNEPTNSTVVTSHGSTTGGRIRLHNLPSRKMLQELHLQQRATKCTFNSDGTRAALSHPDGTVSLWLVLTDKGKSAVPQPPGTVSTTNGGTQTLHPDCVVKVHSASPVLGCSFSPGDGSLIVTGSTDKTAHVFDSINGVVVTCLQGHYDLVEHADFSPDGKVIATCSRDGTIMLWKSPLSASLPPVEITHFVPSRVNPC
ncbi:hypothetical protein Pelo_12720 [Pelomyxa schiedti]|nr:hypothetical protein Pelo_12720 [Pelomyxa schiedti]